MEIYKERRDTYNMNNLELDKRNYLIEKLSKLVNLAYHSAKYAHKYALSENEYSIQASLSYATRSSAFISSAEALYHSNFELLEGYEFDNLFLHFDIFISELLDAYATNHSFQWTDIEFNNLEETYKNSIFSNVE